jgi:hypothetical protein
MVAQVVYLAAAESLSGPALVLLGGEILLLAMATTASIFLAAGKVWAQRALLGFFLAVAIVLSVALIAEILSGVDAWWQRDLPPETSRTLAGEDEYLPAWGIYPAPGFVALLLVPVLACIALLVGSTRPASRLRWGSMVSVAVAAALLLVVLVNLNARKDYFRTSVEQFGRFGLSPRSRRIVEQIRQPVRLTCVYASTRDRDRSDEFRPRVLELLRDLREINGKIEVVDVRTDAEKQRLIERLRSKAALRAAGHDELLRGFLDGSNALQQRCDAAARGFRQLIGRSYLDQWALAANLAETLEGLGEDFQQTAREVRSGLTGLPDYQALTAEVREFLALAEQDLAQLSTLLEEVSGLPEAIRENRPRTDAALQAALAACREARTSLDEEGAAKPEESLRAFLTASGEGISAFSRAAEALQNAGGEGRSRYIANARALQVSLSEQAVLRVAGQQIYGRDSAVGRLTFCAQALQALRQGAQVTLQAGNEQYQKQTLEDFRTYLDELVSAAQATVEQAGSGLETLETMDEPTAALLGGDAPLADLLGPVRSLRERARALKPLEDGDFARGLQQPNIVILEVGANMPEVIPFDEVWPLKSSALGLPPADDEPQPRSFNGDAAICSRLLGETSPPFARVLLTYAAQAQPPRQMQPSAQPPAQPQQYTALQQALRQANLLVETWDLNEPFPAEEETDEARTRPADGENWQEAPPTVLLVLPAEPAAASPWMPSAPSGYAAEHVEKLREAMDRSNGAVFLDHWMPSSPLMPSPETALDAYLREQWGIEVRRDSLVIPAVRAEDAPGKFNLSVQRFTHLPLNAFNPEHPISEPLTAQRTLWTLLSPIELRRPLPEGVSADALLWIRADNDSTWATADLERIVSDYRAGEGSYIAPGEDDLGLGERILLAVAAVRKADRERNVPPRRIVVTTCGQGLRDGYLDEQVPVGGEVARTADPPRANADLVINGVYWLCGREGYIAAGPAVFEPIDPEISPARLRLLQAAGILGVPLAVLAIGGAVLLMRRRS